MTASIPKVGLAEERTATDSRAQLAVGAHANALQHGLTATTLLPALRPGRIPVLLEQLRIEFAPRTSIEDTLLREMARHAAALELSEVAEAAVIRNGANTAAKFLNDDGDDDEILGAAMTTDALDRLSRYRRGHEKSFHQALNSLRESRREHTRQSRSTLADSVLFATESDCREYLMARFLDPDWRCPSCGSSKGHRLTRGHCWQCASCKKQVSHRYGTLFERSPLPLVAWIAAIRYAVADETLNAKKLAELISMPRIATARTMLQRIRAAISAGNARSQLAGLTAFPLHPGSG